jgi:2-haloacid dehalogenase
VMGAAAFGFRAVWINRSGIPDEYGEFVMARQISDLAALPGLILSQ